MQVFSLLGFNDYNGSELVGVFGSLGDLKDCVVQGNGSWFYDDLGYVVSELGEKIEDVLATVEYLSFVDHSGAQRSY